MVAAADCQPRAAHVDGAKNDAPPHETSPVEVVGAGPAGLAAAITLARGGRRVVVHEARHEVGHRFGRDLQGLENWSGNRDVLELLCESGLGTDFDRAPCFEGTFFDAWDHAYPVRASRPFCYLVERGPGPGSLDRALLDQALALGVEVRFGSRVRSLDVHGIFASGPKKADAIAVGYQFETQLADGFWIVLDDNIAPGGYAYLLTMHGRGTVKSCMFRDFGRQRVYVKRTIERFRRLLGVDFREARFHGGVGNFSLPTTAYRGGYPVIGEAAGFQDAFAGFGMRYAVLSGVLAARSLIDGSDYDAAWQCEMKRPMETAHVNRAIYDRLDNRGYRWMLRLQSWNGDGMKFLSWLYRSERTRHLLFDLAQRMKA